MKVFALGAAGTYGKMAAKKLVASDVVSEIVIAGRNIESAKRAAAELEPKASAVQVDLHDTSHLAALATDSDIMVNTAGPGFKVLLPALRGAIKAGVNYCDLCCDGPTREKALDLDGSARESGISALMGIGVIGLSNLLMMHAAQQIDHAKELRFCIFSAVAEYGDGPKALLDEWEKLGHADSSWQDIIRQAVGPVRIYRDRRWLDVDPLEDQVRLSPPGMGEIFAVPGGLPEPITIPRVLKGLESVSAVSSFHPPELNEIYCQLGRRIARGEIDESKAATLFFEHLASLPKEAQKLPKGGESGWLMWAEAIGTKNNKPTRYRCWPNGDWATTAGPLAAAALKILRGEVKLKGVLSPESCLDPMPFFAEVAKIEGVKTRKERLLGESIEVLRGQ